MRTVFTPLLSALALALVAVLHAPPAHADAGFTPIPPPKGAPAQPLALRIVRYDGHTNGELVVQVKNTGKSAQTLDARGLYFVPRMDPKDAPQRLGAVGPVQTKKGGALVRSETLAIEAGATVELVLDVFCIDSHRPSPSPETPFALATDRLPAELTRAIDTDAKKAVEAAGGYAAPTSKSAAQAEVWKNRDKSWVKLQGEGAQEDGK